jgi:hypothetical protein
MTVENFTIQEAVLLELKLSHNCGNILEEVYTYFL